MGLLAYIKNSFKDDIFLQYLRYLFSRKYMCRQRCKNPSKTAIYHSRTESPLRSGVYYYFYRCRKCGRGYHTEGPQ